MTLRSAARPPGHDTVAGTFRFASELVAWVATPWALWPWWVAVLVTALCVTVVVTEQPRWRALVRSGRR
jgi:hypothetical protein